MNNASRSGARGGAERAILFFLFLAGRLPFLALGFTVAKKVT